jgi:hypothetical protein
MVLVQDEELPPLTRVRWDAASAKFCTHDLSILSDFDAVSGPR